MEGEVGGWDDDDDDDDGSAGFGRSHGSGPGDDLRGGPVRARYTGLRGVRRAVPVGSGASELAIGIANSLPVLSSRAVRRVLYVYAVPSTVPGRAAGTVRRTRYGLRRRRPAGPGIAETTKTKKHKSQNVSLSASIDT